MSDLPEPFTAAMVRLMADGHRVYTETQMLEREAMWRARVAAMQAKIDALMLEYCPDEMTAEQLAEWARHQKPAGKGPT